METSLVTIQLLFVDGSYRARQETVGLRGSLIQLLNKLHLDKGDDIGVLFSILNVYEISNEDFNNLKIDCKYDFMEKVKR